MAEKKNSKKNSKALNNNAKPKNTNSKVNKNQKKVKEFLTIPKSVQDSIPYRNVYKDGIIEIEEGVYTKSYLLDDVNFKIATQEDQENIFMAYGDLLNTFSPEVHFQITINNKNIDKDKFFSETLLKPKDDELKEYREEYNQMLLDKLSEGRNNLMREKYLTVSLKADTIEDAIANFSQLDTKINEALVKISGNHGGKSKEPLSLEKRLEILYNVYNLNSPIQFDKHINVNGLGKKEQKSTKKEKDYAFFDMRRMARMGMTSKDLIGPESLSFKRDYFESGDVLGRVEFIDNLPAFMNCEILSDIADIPCNMLLSVHFDSLPQDKSLKLIKNQMLNINANVVDAQKKATKNGYGIELISPELQRAQEEGKKLMNDITGRNQKLFFVTVVVVHFADDLEQLNKDSKSIQSTVSRHLCQSKKLNYQQELGLTTALPLASNKIKIKRLLTTESASVFIPFSTQELVQGNGMYYGLNAVSKNMILYNRTNGINYNGVILGMPGSGKSFAAKREMVNVLLNTDDDVFVIDPEGEYSPLANLFGGEVVRVAAGSDVYINPLDMDMQYADKDDPVTLKSDYIGSLCEIAVGGQFGLTPAQKSIIDRCVRTIYQPYLEHMSKINSNVKDSEKITCDTEASPTMQNFFEELIAQPQPDAQNIALALELYVLGSLDNFAHRTNVQLNNRFVVYDIKDIGTQMKEMGLQVCLNDVWNRIIMNRKKGKRTWFYIDEFHLLAKTQSSARFVQEIYKRARKWNGIPTGITQNVEDLLKTPETRGVVNNCSFVMMLNQSPVDRSDLATMFNISSTQLQYITAADAGQGLIFNGKTIVPFKDSFPKNTELYKAMTTKPAEGFS